jgi:hypothetical protein
MWMEPWGTRRTQRVPEAERMVDPVGKLLVLLAPFMLRQTDASVPTAHPDTASEKSTSKVS